MTKIITEFKPSVHGFNFGNSFSAEEIMDEMYDVPSFMVPDDKWGLCGGMCFAALDRYFKNIPIPSRTNSPSKSDTLFSELVKRQDAAVDSVGWTKIVDYQIRPNEDAWYEPMDSLGKKTQTTQWNSVKNKLRNGIPTTICLIRASRLELYNIGDNHMVVVYGYSYNSDSMRLILNVYDPNMPNNDDVVIGLTLGQSDNQIDIYQDPGTDPRGFLRIPYDGKEVLIKPTIPDIIAPAPPEDDMEWIWTIF